MGKMGKKLLSRKQFMDMCKAVFDFEEYGIKSYLKDIRLHSGRRALTYFFEDSNEIEYQIRFSFDGYREFYIYVYEVIDINRYKEVFSAHFNLNCSEGLMCLVYRSGFSFLKKSFNLGNLISVYDGHVHGSLQ